MLTAALALATGLVAIVAGLLRLGFLASFISEPVLKGFIIGLALTIMIGQLPAMLGVDKGSGNFFEKTWDLVTAPRGHGRPRPWSASGASSRCWCCGGGCPSCPGRWSSS